MMVVAVVSTASIAQLCQEDQENQENQGDEEPTVKLPYLCSMAHRFTEVHFLNPAAV